MLGMGIHFCEHGSNHIILHAQFLDPFLVIGSGLVAYRHVLKLGLFREVYIVHWPESCSPPILIGADRPGIIEKFSI